jgi:NAD(P)H-hydrate repair Nnr-like enzyme with NAD(P)H-hydrate dehydratase domain
VSTPVVLTPHEGELARLLVNTSTTTAEELAAATGTVVVAKGPTTDVTNAAESVALSNGTPALAKAGTGDVLAGIIASLCAQGMSAFDAAVAGVYLHAEAGKVAELKYGRRSVMAEDVIKALPAAIQAY